MPKGCSGGCLRGASKGCLLHYTGVIKLQGRERLGSLIGEASGPLTSPCRTSEPGTLSSGTGHRSKGENFHLGVLGYLGASIPGALSCCLVWMSHVCYVEREPALNPMLPALSTKMCYTVINFCVHFQFGRLHLGQAHPPPCLLGKAWQTLPVMSTSKSAVTFKNDGLKCVSMTWRAISARPWS